MHVCTYIKNIRRSVEIRSQLEGTKPPFLAAVRDEHPEQPTKQRRTAAAAVAAAGGGSGGGGNDGGGGSEAPGSSCHPESFSEMEIFEDSATDNLG